MAMYCHFRARDVDNKNLLFTKLLQNLLTKEIIKKGVWGILFFKVMGKNFYCLLRLTAQAGEG
jgi:hypothetical protein